MRKLHWIAGGVVVLTALVGGLIYLALDARSRALGPIAEGQAPPLPTDSGIASPTVRISPALPSPQARTTPQATAIVVTRKAATTPVIATSASVVAGPTGVEENLTLLATASASSVLAPEQTEQFGLVRFDPGNALDQDLTTSWVEGVEGAGLGEQLVLAFPRPISITRLGIDVGFDRDEPIFYANNRVRIARLGFSDGSAQTFEFLDQRGIQYIPIAAVTTTSIELVIVKVYPGLKFEDTPIAEVEVWGYMN